MIFILESHFALYNLNLNFKLLLRVKIIFTLRDFNEHKVWALIIFAQVIIFCKPMLVRV